MIKIQTAKNTMILIQSTKDFNIIKRGININYIDESSENYVYNENYVEYQIITKGMTKRKNIGINKDLRKLLFGK